MIETLNISLFFSQQNIKYAVICSGSRSAPLTISFVRNEKIKCYFFYDERSAAYAALGMAQRLQEPVVLICTSGTAVLNFAPAVAEAFYQEIPLIVLTADRPTEWIGQRDGQAIMQENIFEPNIRKCYSIQMGDTHPDNVWYYNRILNEAILKSKSSTSGPVHINFGFREPFYPNPDSKLNDSLIPLVYRFNTHRSIDKNIWEHLIFILLSSPKRLIVCGQLFPNKATATSLETFTSENKVPVIADVNSNVQYLSNAILYSDLIVSCVEESVINDIAPEILITFGNHIVSKNIKNFLKNNKPKVHIHIQESDEIVDTYQTVTHVLNVTLESFVGELMNRVRLNGGKDYLNKWKNLDEIANEGVNEYVTMNPSSELSIIKNITYFFPPKSIVHTANSLSVRYLNLISSDNTLNYCNRGTSGIDGCTSTALGAALVSNEIVTLITGDVAFVYDRNAFWNEFIPSNFRIIILNNKGGAIFRSVDGAKNQPELEKYFVGNNSFTAKHVASESKIQYTFLDAAKFDEKILDTFFDDSNSAKILEIETKNENTPEIFVKLREIVARNLQNSVDVASTISRN